MAATSLSLHKTPFLHRFFGFSNKPISHSGQQIRAPANPTQISTFRSCSSCSLNSYTSNFGHGTAFKELGCSKIGFVQLGFDRLRISAVADGGLGDGADGGFGGSGDGSSSGRGEGDSGGSDFPFIHWYWARLAYPVATKAVTSALLTSIGDLICQLVIQQEPSLYLKGTSLALLTLLGLALVGAALQFWLTEFLQALYVFFVIYCIEMVCMFFFHIFCFIAIVARAYPIVGRQGLLEDEVWSLPKFRYRLASPLRASGNSEKQDVCGTGMETSNSNSTDELSLQLEDSVCCICLSQYIDGTELYALPCNHHFHCECISKWLRINVICPLCRCNIQRGNTLV